MTVRPFRPEDRSACLEIFDSNVPGSFLERERTAFAAFIDDLPGPYLVVERSGRVLACGGFAASADGHAVDLCWGMVELTHQGQGLGRLLLDARIARSRAAYPDRHIRMNTSQHTVGFFEKRGFQTVRITRNGFAPGLDQYDLVLPAPTGA